LLRAGGQGTTTALASGIAAGACRGTSATKCRERYLRMTSWGGRCAEMRMNAEREVMSSERKREKEREREKERKRKKTRERKGERQRERERKRKRERERGRGRERENIMGVYLVVSGSDPDAGTRS